MTLIRSTGMRPPYVLLLLIVSLAGWTAQSWSEGKSPPTDAALGYLLPIFHPRLAWSGTRRPGEGRQTSKRVATEDHRFPESTVGCPGIARARFRGGIGWQQQSESMLGPQTNAADHATARRVASSVENIEAASSGGNC